MRKQKKKQQKKNYFPHWNSPYIRLYVWRQANCAQSIIDRCRESDSMRYDALMQI